MEKGELQTARKTKQNQGPRQSTPITTGPPHNSRLLVSKAILPVPNRPCHSSLKAGYRSHSYLPGSCFCPPHIWVIPYLTLFCWRSKAVPLHLSSDSKEVVPTKEEVPEHLGSVLTIFSLISRPVLHQAFVKKKKKKTGVTPVKAFVLKKQHFKVVLLSLPTTCAKDGLDRKD